MLQTNEYFIYYYRVLQIIGVLIDTIRLSVSVSKETYYTSKRDLVLER